MEKKAVVIALLVSLIVSLTINIVYVYGVSRPSPAPAAASRGGGGGAPGGGMRQQQAPSPEVLKLYQEKAKLLQQKFAEAEKEYKANALPLEEYLKTSLQRDEAQLAAWRRELGVMNRSVAGGPAELVVRVKALTALADELEKEHKAGKRALKELLEARSELVQAQIRLAELAARLRDNQSWTKSAEEAKNLPYPLQEEALKSLLVSEQPGVPGSAY